MTGFVVGFGMICALKKNKNRDMYSAPTVGKSGHSDRE